MSSYITSRNKIWLLSSALFTKVSDPNDYPFISIYVSISEREGLSLTLKLLSKDLQRLQFEFSDNHKLST